MGIANTLTSSVNRLYASWVVMIFRQHLGRMTLSPFSIIQLENSPKSCFKTLTQMVGRPIAKTLNASASSQTTPWINKKNWVAQFLELLLFHRSFFLQDNMKYEGLGSQKNPWDPNDFQAKSSPSKAPGTINEHCVAAPAWPTGRSSRRGIFHGKRSHQSHLFGKAGKKCRKMAGDMLSMPGQLSVVEWAFFVVFFSNLVASRKPAVPMFFGGDPG